MMNKSLACLAALSALLLVACVDDPTQLDGIEEVEEVEEVGETGTATGPKADDARVLIGQQPRCKQVIETEGACAVACDPAAVLTFVPQGTCTVFRCTLEDGNQLNIGGCR